MRFNILFIRQLLIIFQACDRDEIFFLPLRVIIRGKDRYVPYLLINKYEYLILCEGIES